MQKKIITGSDLVKVLNVLSECAYCPVVVAVDDYLAKLILVTFGSHQARLLEDVGFHFTAVFANDSKLEVWIRKN